MKLVGHHTSFCFGTFHFTNFLFLKGSHSYISKEAKPYLLLQINGYNGTQCPPRSRCLESFRLGSWPNNSQPPGICGY